MDGDDAARAIASSPLWTGCLAATFLQALFPMQAIAQDDGARLYMMTPADTTIASLRLHHLDSNLTVDPGTVNEGTEQNTTLAVLQFVQEFELAGNQAFVFLVVPASRIENDAQPNVPASSTSGLGDVQLGFVQGIFGTPSLPAAQYFEHRPGLAVNVLAKIFFPTGDYEADRKVNIGANRWALRLGMPVIYAIGDRMGDPGLMTVELMPTVTFFGENEKPFNAGLTQQEPLFIFEAHLTQGLARKFWASLDLLWRRGGEMEVDGIGADNAQRALSLGATGTLALGPSSSLRLSYGRVVDRNEHGPNGWMFRSILGFVF